MLLNVILFILLQSRHVLYVIKARFHAKGCSFDDNYSILLIIIEFKEMVLKMDGIRELITVAFY